MDIEVGIYLLILIYFIVFYVHLRIFTRRETGITTFFIFGFSFFIYNISIVLEVLLTGNNSFWIAGAVGITEFYPSDLLTISVLSIFSLLGFAHGLLLVNFKLRPALKEKYKTPRSINVLLFVFLLSLILLYRNDLLSITSYIEYVLFYSKNPNYSYLLKVVFIITSVRIAYLILNNSIGLKKSLLYLFPLIFFGFFSGDKDPLLIVFICFLVNFYRKRFYPSKLIASILLISFSMGVGLVFFGQFRAGKISLTLNEYVDRIGFFKGTDPGGVMISLVYEIRHNESLEYGQSYLKNPVLWIPKAIYPNRPLDLAENFAKENIDNWKRGLGLGYASLAEGYVNFGTIGVYLHYFLIAIYWGGIWNLIKRLFSSFNPNYFNAIYLIVGFYIISIMHRAPSSFLVTGLLHILVPLIIGLIFLDKPRRIWEKLSSK